MVVHLLVLRVPLGILCPVPYGRPANPYVLAMTWEEEYLSPCRQALHESRVILTPSTVVAHEEPREVLPTTPGERLDLDLEEMSSDTYDAFSIGINPRNLPAISIDVDSLGGPDAQITPACRPCCCNPGTSSAVTMCLKLYFFFLFSRFLS
ncbi:hypothetical protein PVAP13_7NG133234 [Panicum virgatum]|uniref:Uncharacterized protein n=1 Tax=Panicum virgatum TaxID=38727 RepID=A0A8T0PUK5_PANVG|nr:hypothetical protein PVAP13_7NG133234 [Panicum virgatum]